MDKKFASNINDLIKQRKPFAIATVISVEGSASAKPGSQALINQQGENIYGWVGGGCADSFVCDQATEALKEMKPRTVKADLDDEVFGLGMPCGGHMNIFVQPHFPAPQIRVVESNELFPSLVETLHVLNYEVQSDPRFSVESHFCQKTEVDLSKIDGLNIRPPEKALLAAALMTCTNYSGSGRSLSLVKENKDSISFQPNSFGKPFTVSIFGDTRITQSLEQIIKITGWQQSSPQPGGAVVIGSHHKGDLDALNESFSKNVAYVGLVASKKRCQLLQEQYAKDNELTQSQANIIFGPTGLDLGGQSPEEIALSIAAELVTLKAGIKFDELT